MDQFSVFQVCGVQGRREGERKALPGWSQRIHGWFVRGAVLTNEEQHHEPLEPHGFAMAKLEMNATWRTFVPE